MLRCYRFAIGLSLVLGCALAARAQDDVRRDENRDDASRRDTVAPEREEAADRDAGGDSELRRRGLFDRDAAQRQREQGDQPGRGDERDAEQPGRRGRQPAAGVRDGGMRPAGEMSTRDALMMGTRDVLRVHSRTSPASRGDMERLEQTDPEMYALAKADMELELQTRQLVEQFHRAANDDDREQVRRKLVAVVENHFAVRQQRRELEIKRLESQLQRLRDAVKKRSAERQRIMEQHISQLLGTDDSGF
ncbi:MAG TPA: hypothetical protein VHC22_06935 [Pirellulales bacterium]|nr:hypothetical protein [Pirellulales bacterium]